MKHKLFLAFLLLLCLHIKSLAQTELWSTTPVGGEFKTGSVYKIAPDGSNYSTLFDFNTPGLHASSPEYSTPSNGGNGKLYGLTRLGGLAGAGIIFSYDTTTSTFLKLHSFGLGADGKFPYGSLMLASDGKLYGMTYSGGANNNGIIFKIDPLTNAYTKLVDFALTGPALPQGDLIEANNGLLYGLSNGGGTSGDGTLFSFDRNTNLIQTLVSFSTATTGTGTTGTLMQAANGKLYGTTVTGGLNSNGTLFSYDIITNTYTKRFDFLSATTGRSPRGRLVQHPSGLIYGMTQTGGASTSGTLYSFDDNLSSFNVVHTFNSASSTNGGSPWGSLLLASDGKFYGLTLTGSPYGILFSCTPAGSFSKLASFNPTAHGSGLTGSLVEMGSGNLFGMAKTGGTGERGTFYKIKISGSILTKLADFSYFSNGSQPETSLLKAANGKLYGLTSAGGINNSGTLFRMNPDSGTFTKLHDFAALAKPEGKLIQASDGKLYGLTYGGGTSGAGTIFSFDTTTNLHTTLYNLQFGSLPIYPVGGFVQANNGLLYGMSHSGGLNSKGTLFSFNIATLTLTKIIDFDGALKGELPFGDLLKSSNGTLYGMTTYGGVNSSGVLFSFNPSTNAYSKKVDFGGVLGVNPFGSLMEATGGKLYGTASAGGLNSKGIIFSFDTITNILSELYSFPGNAGDSLGQTPRGTLFQAANGLIYGTAKDGGNNMEGVIFHFNPSGNIYTKIKDLDDSIASQPDKAAFVEVGISIQTGNVSSSICKGSIISVPFNCSGTLNNSNVFTAQLSNSSGSFSSPLNIGTLSATSSGTIQAVIPANTAAGSAYKIRVVASDPAIIGSPTTNLIAINQFTVALFTESMGIVGGTTSIAAHESANGFDNDAFTMTGTTTDLRANVPSTGYDEASGAASVFFNTTLGRTFEISGINTVGKTGLQLSFGIYKNSTFTINDLLVVEVSDNGGPYTQLNYTLPTGTGTAAWFYRTATGVIPQSTNLRIRFSQTYIIPTNQYRVDDIKLTAEDFAPGISASGSLSLCNGSTVTLTATSAKSFLWSNSATTQSILVSSGGNYFCTLTGENDCVVTSNTLVVSNATVTDYNVTGGATVCSGSGVEIGLDDSELNVNYQLIKDNTTTIGSSVPGTGSQLSFGNHSIAGAYRIVATSTIAVCSDTMSGIATITVLPNTTYFRDFDNDGFGDPAVDSVTCFGVPVGYVLNSSDCYDNDPLQIPSQTWYIDADGDGYSSGVILVQCLRPLNGYASSELIALSGDCNDAAASAYPGATEICNGIDDDCDLYIDEGCGPKIYCIGPSASYTPPSGPSYFNQFSPYPTLTAAISALNGFGTSEHVIFEFQLNYTGTGETFPLSITYQGTPSATAVIRPRSDQASQLVIAGSVAIGNRLIYFNGADYVTFDGSAGGAMGVDSKILLRNLLNAGTAGKNIEFVNDATHNTLNALIVEGGYNAGACIEIGATTGSSGNDNLLIQNCHIRDRSDVTHSVIPVKGISSVSSGTDNSANSNNSILANKIQNVRTGVLIGSTGNNGAWQINDNHIYFSNTIPALTMLEGVKFHTTDTASLEIYGNFIGGTEPFTGGAYMNNKQSSFSGIDVNISNSSYQASVSNNKVSNILWSGADGRYLYGVNTNGGPVKIHNNTIGDPLLANSIVTGDTTDVTFYGIYSYSTQNTSPAIVTDNIVSNINLKDSAM